MPVEDQTLYNAELQLKLIEMFSCSFARHPDLQVQDSVAPRFVYVVLRIQKFTGKKWDILKLLEQVTSQNREQTSPVFLLNPCGGHEQFINRLLNLNSWLGK